MATFSACYYFPKCKPITEIRICPINKITTNNNEKNILIPFYFPAVL